MVKFLFQKGHKHKPETIIKLSRAKLGSKNPNWKGGRTDDGRGYIMVKVGIKEYQLEHRYIMEQHIGRKLKKNEHIHHINGIKDDNRIENLVMMTKNEHHRHHLIKYYGCREVDCIRPHRAKQMCAYHYNKSLLNRR